MNDNSWDLGLRCGSDEYPILQNSPGLPTFFTTPVRVHHRVDLMQGLFHHDVQPQTHVGGNHVHRQCSGKQRNTTSTIDPDLTKLSAADNST